MSVNGCTRGLHERHPSLAKVQHRRVEARRERNSLSIIIAREISSFFFPPFYSNLRISVIKKGVLKFRKSRDDGNGKCNINLEIHRKYTSMEECIKIFVG